MPGKSDIIIQKGEGKMKDKVTIDYTTEQKMCVSCGVCAGVCPVHCIEMKLTEKGDAYQPFIDKEKCIECGKCKRVCPGLGWTVFKGGSGKTAERPELKGDIRKVYTAWLKDESMLKQCVSGGTATALTTGLLARGIYKKAFLVDSWHINEKLAARQTDAGFSCGRTAGSRYTPVSQEEAVLYIRKNRDDKVIMIGTACALNGILKVIEEEKLNRDQYLLIGLFCDKTLNRHMFTYFNHIAEGELSELYYRSKKKKNWPGNVRLVFRDGSEQFMPAAKRMEVKEYMQLQRCLYCYDKLNESCDIALGDNYTKKDAWPSGSNSVIIRTKRGEDAFEYIRELLEVKDALYEDVYESQRMDERKQQLQFAAILRRQQGIKLYSELEYENLSYSGKTEKEYGKRLKKLEAGRDFGLAPERLFNFMEKEKRKVSRNQKLKKLRGLPKKILKLPGKILKEGN